ncbi:MAG: hypothetical protein H7061_14105 [Bdellovibrionaceae bacterium]|nr:hypothetical protein [Bdellovibrio sp.]
MFKIITLFLFSLAFAGCVSGLKKSTVGNSSINNRIQRASIKSPVNNEKRIMEELTGQERATGPAAADLKNAPLPTRHFYAGQRAALQKNYIMAIKHFNTVIKKYPNSNQVKPALLAKAQVYKEMGLAEPAQLNMTLAQRKINFKPKKQIVRNSTSNKPQVINR